MIKLYLDTNLLIAYYYSQDSEGKHGRSKDFFSEIIKKTKIKLYCSHFTITEFTQAYITKQDVSEAEVHRVANSLLLTNKIDKKYSFTMVDVKGKQKGYTFEDFFLDIQTVLLSTTPRPGIADAMHAIIMENNKIKNIVTFDKGDFENIEKVVALEPEEVLDKW